MVSERELADLKAKLDERDAEIERLRFQCAELDFGAGGVMAQLAERDGLAAALVAVFAKANEWIRVFESIDEDDFKPAVHAKLHAVYKTPDNWDAEDRAESILAARDARITAEARRKALVEVAEAALEKYGASPTQHWLAKLAQEADHASPPESDAKAFERDNDDAEMPGGFN